MGLIGLIRAYYGGLLGILSGLTKSTDHPSGGLKPRYVDTSQRASGDRATIIPVRDALRPAKPLHFLTLRLQVCKQYPLWAPKYINMTYFGLFGAPG